MTLDSSIPGRLRHVSKRQPCPICHKPDWCELCPDGAVHCMRVESPSPCQYRQGGWWHNLPQRRDDNPTETRLYPVAPKTAFLALLCRKRSAVTLLHPWRQQRRAMASTALSWLLLPSRQRIAHTSWDYHARSAKRH